MAVQKQSIPSFASIISVLSIVFYCAGFLRVELELHEQKKRIYALESITEAKPPSNDPDIIKNAPGIQSSKHHRNSRQVDSTENATEAKGTSEGMLKKNELLLEMMRVQLCQSIGVTCSSGRPGPPGLPGPKGCRGDRGRRGPKGRTGNSGVKGIVGSPGKSGKKGIMGAAGLKGDTGTKGEKGDKGPAGMPGPKGNGGPAGVKGTRGDIGTAGPPGSTGPPGSRGYKGDRGRNGEKGRTGGKGDKGTMGPMGLKGETGTKGEKGNLGPEGMPGTKGNKGEAGMPGTKGDKGEPGMPGTKGNKGAAGLPGTKGGKGSRGCKGDRGRKGQKGEAGIDWCLLLNIIGGHGAECVNTDGSYKCECSSGFKQDLDGNCSDLDECITGASDCNDNAECTNTQGSYTCSCKPGFTGDGKNCAETKSSAVHLSSTTNIRETTNVVQSQGSTRSPAQAGGVTSLTIPEARTTAGIEQSRASTMNLSHMSIAAGVLSTSLPLGRTSTVMSSGIEQTLAQTTSLALKSTVMNMNQSMSNVLQSNQSSVTTRASLASSSPIKPLLFTTRVLPYSSNIRTSVSSSGLAGNNTSDMTSRSAVMPNASKNQNMTHSITVKLDSVQTSMYETSSTMVTLPKTSLPPETESSVVQALSSATSIRETTTVVQSQGLTRSLVQAGGVTSKTLPEAWTTAGIEQSKASAMNLSPMSIAGGVLSTSWPHAMRSAAMSSQTPSIEQSLAQTTSPAHRSISGDGASTRVQMEQSVSHEVQSNQNSVTTRATAIQHSCTTTTICN